MDNSSIIDIIEEYGAKSVSLKTHISIDSLNKLSKGDYSDFTKIQTLGFIKIIEREYNMDLLDIKNNIREFFVKSDNKIQNHFITTDVDSSVENGGISKLFFYIFIIMIFYGLWYIYENYYKTTLVQSGIKPQKTYFNIENNNSKDNNKIENNKIIKIKKPVETKIIIEENKTKDNNKSIVLHILKNVENDTNKSNDINQTIQTYEIVNDNIEEDKKIITRTNIELIPSSKMWFGFINITNPKKRWHKSYKRTTPYNFDVNNSRWLMMTHKAKFTIKDIENIKEYDIKSTTYFKIDKEDGIKELTYDKYKALGGYRVW